MVTGSALAFGILATAPHGRADERLRQIIPQQSSKREQTSERSTCKLGYA
jgi:hypothetical protein